MIVCPRCGHRNPPGNTFCGQCSLGLNEKTIMEFDKQKEMSSKLGFDVQGMTDDKDFMVKMMNTMAHEWETEQQKKEKEIK